MNHLPAIAVLTLLAAACASHLPNLEDPKSCPVGSWEARTIHYTVSSSFTDEEADTIRHGLSDWTTAVGGRIVFELGGSDMVIYKVEERVDIPYDLPAENTIALQTKNEEWFAFKYFRDKPDFFRAGIIHETGHYLGLPHSSDPTSCMQPDLHVNCLDETGGVPLSDVHTYCKLRTCRCWTPPLSPK